ncbi:hypothetical protein HanXRQr2_Chr06g0250201 [Helianthus annuus]|uniref:Uncharacterized protein n=1 Tax=Helianthus annuus TaxID=4232 RepID=A0A9K3IS18_HELAN|nr:hypothetical protein HanXRQr2_Chr06g0250201 [Helianthus annuus]
MMKEKRMGITHSLNGILLQQEVHTFVKASSSRTFELVVELRGIVYNNVTMEDLST